MSYARIAKAVAETPWAITREKLDEIESILAFHMAGNKFTAEELRARLGEPQRAEPVKRGTIAVIPLQGVISHRMGGMTEMSGGMSTERFAKMFREALNDDSVSAIVADIDTPGGTITGCTELFAEIFAARGTKKLIGHVNALGASAGYWIASAFEEIWSTPSGSIGSIGVITPEFVDTSKADEKNGISREVFSAGKYKAEMHGPLTDEARAAIKARVNTAYQMMAKDIAKGRNVELSAVTGGFGEGRLLFAKDALKLGMIDKIGTFDELVGKLVGRRQATGMRAEDEAPELAMTIEEPKAPVADPSRVIRDRIERF